MSELLVFLLLAVAGTAVLWIWLKRGIGKNGARPQVHSESTTSHGPVSEDESEAAESLQREPLTEPVQPGNTAASQENLVLEQSSLFTETTLDVVEEAVAEPGTFEESDETRIGENGRDNPKNELTAVPRSSLTEESGDRDDADSDRSAIDDTEEGGQDLDAQAPPDEPKDKKSDLKTEADVSSDEPRTPTPGDSGETDAPVKELNDDGDDTKDKSSHERREPGTPQADSRNEPLYVPPRRTPKRGRYKPPRRRPEQAADSVSGTRDSDSSSTATNSLGLRLQLTFARRGGVKTLAVVPYRSAQAPDDLDIIDQDTEDKLHLSRLHQNCYVPIGLDDAGDVLQRGIQWYESSETPGWRWVMLGRDIYVLTPGDPFGLAGFVSVDRLWLNRRHVVLAVATLQDKVVAALQQAGCTGFTVLDDEDGRVPPGWLLFRDVTPKCSVPRSDTQTVFNPLCPLPEIKPEFAGGIRLDRRTWLAGFPPRIRFSAELEPGVQVLIDGRVALCAADGAYETSGWNDVGSHLLWFGDQTVTYEIRMMKEDWPCWPAHDFGMSAAICGARTYCTDGSPQYQVRVTPSNPLLIGPRPGDIFCCHPHQDVGRNPTVSMVPFAPVWALPPDPIHADRRIAKILRVDWAEPIWAGQSGETRIAEDAIRAWVAAINDAGRKHLDVSEADADSKSLWRRYRTVARQLWRTRR